MTGTFPTVVCLTPVWNEAWILERFLARASIWADHIVIADQGSDDGSREIARRHPKVTLLENASASYDEGARQRLLVDAARAIPGPRVLVALDADESLSDTVRESSTWRDAISAPPGTVIRLPLVNLLPGLEEAWVPAEPFVVGLVDDERPHTGERMHSTRVPVCPDAPTFDLVDVAVLHYQYLDERRMRAKQRWYQCLERVTLPRKRPAEIYRQYHYMDAWKTEEICPVQPSWLDGCIGGPDARAGGEDAWHRRILDLMRAHGAAAFRRVDIWDVDWASEAKRLGVDVVPSRLSDDRGRLDRTVLRWLRFAQPRRRSAAVRLISRSLRLVGW